MKPSEPQDHSLFNTVKPSEPRYRCTTNEFVDRCMEYNFDGQRKIREPTEPRIGRKNWQNSLVEIVSKDTGTGATKCSSTKKGR